MRRWLIALGVVSALTLGVGVGFKRDPFGDALVPGLRGSAGNDATLGYIYGMKDFEGLGSTQLMTQLWFDPYLGSDAAECSYTAPCRSVHEMKERCLPYTRCTVKNKGRNRVAFGMLTLLLDSTTFALGEDTFKIGETVSGTWNGVAGTGTVVDWFMDQNTYILVITRVTGTADPIATNTVTTSTAPAKTVTITSVTNTLNLGGGTTIDDGIPTDCVDRDALCVVFDTEDPDVPVLIDGNRFGTQGNATADSCGLFCGANTAAGGWVGVANIQVQNLAADAFSSAASGAGVSGKLMTMRVRIVNVRNGTEARGIVVSTNNCFTTHGTGGLGGVVAFNTGESDSRVDDAGGAGSCLAITDNNKATFIGQSSITSTPVAAQVSNVLTITQGDVVVVGHRLLNPSTGFTAVATAGQRLQMARVVVDQKNVAGNANNILVNNNTVVAVLLFETSIIGRGRGLTLNSFTGAISVFARGLLIDNSDFWILTADATSNTAALDIQQSYFDDEDVAGADTDEWAFTGTAGTPYATRALAAAAIPAWTLWTNSQNSGAGADGTAWTTDTLNFRCASTELCFEAFRAPYTIDLTTVFASDTDETCTPKGVFAGGGRLCSLTLVPIHIGAR